MKSRRYAFALVLAASGLCLAPWAAPARAQDDPRGAAAAVPDAALVARRLASRNPLERRGVAEELARTAAVEHRRLLEGYRWQERDARVRVAMDWALYRLGKNEALFDVVRALDSKQSEQALGYLAQIESPEPLYTFLAHTNGRTQARLLEVLARVGDRATLEQLKPFINSPDPHISDAAKFAEREINIRLEETPAVAPKRPRQTGRGTDEQPKR